MDSLVSALNEVLATGFVLYLKTHAAHWNVEGPFFGSLHAMFERQYEDLHDAVDDYAEKLRQLDVYVDASLGEFIKRSRVSGFSGPVPALAMVAELRRDHETMLTVLEAALDAAEEADQEGIIAFLGTRVEAHQKWRWFLRVTAKSV